MSRWVRAVTPSLVALIAVAGLASPASADPTPKQACTKSTRDFAKLAAPTRVSDLRNGLLEIKLAAPLGGQLLPGTDIGRWNEFRLHLERRYDALDDLIEALGVGAEKHAPDAEATQSALALAQQETTALDAARAAAKLPAACSSQAFGTAYLTAAAALINQDVPAPTSDFVTAATPPCNRLAQRANDAQHVHPTDVLPSADYAFASFDLDLSRLTPPPAVATQFATLKSLSSGTLQRLDSLLLRYGDLLPKSVGKKVGREIKALAPQFVKATQAVGLTC